MNKFKSIPAEMREGITQKNARTCVKLIVNFFITESNLKIFSRNKILKDGKYAVYTIQNLQKFECLKRVLLAQN